jgi:hypothetical protein
MNAFCEQQKEREENAKKAKEEVEEKERLEAQQKQENETKDGEDDEKEVVVPADISAKEVSSNSEPVTTAAAADLIGTSAGSGDGIISAAVAASSASPEADPAKTDDPAMTVTDPAANVPAAVSLSTDPTVTAPALPAPDGPAEPAFDSPVPDPAMPPTNSMASPADGVAARTPASADAVAVPATPADAEGDSLQSANSSAQPKKKKKKKKKKPVVRKWIFLIGVLEAGVIYLSHYFSVVEFVILIDMIAKILDLPQLEAHTVSQLQ